MSEAPMDGDGGEITAEQSARLAGEAVEYFTLKILSRPSVEWTQHERAFLKGLLPILKARKASVESFIVHLKIELKRAVAEQ